LRLLQMSRSHTTLGQLRRSDRSSVSGLQHLKLGLRPATLCQPFAHGLQHSRQAGMEHQLRKEKRFVFYPIVNAEHEKDVLERLVGPAPEPFHSQHGGSEPGPAPGDVKMLDQAPTGRVDVPFLVRNIEPAKGPRTGGLSSARWVRRASNFQAPGTRPGPGL